MDNTKRDILSLISHHIELQEAINGTLMVDLNQFGLNANLFDISPETKELIENIQVNIEENIVSLMDFYTTYEEIREERKEPFPLQKFYAADTLPKDQED